MTRSAPFIGATVLALAAVVSSSGVTNVTFVISGLALGLAVSLAATIAPWERIPAWADAVAAVTFMVALAAIREGAGGATSGHAPLLLIPLLWLAVVGTGLRAAIGIVAMAGILGGSLVAAGSADLPDQLHRLALLMLAGGFSVLTVRRLVGEAKRAALEVEQQARRLAEQVAMTKAVLDTADDMIVSFDENHRIVGINNSVVDGLGWSPDALIGQTLIDTILPGGDRDWSRTAVGLVENGDALVRGGGQVETEFRRADGTTVPVEISVAITTERGAVITHAFARDISSRRQVEQAMAAHLHDLARLLSVARDLGRPTAATDGRAAICEAARELAAADLALFFEADPGGEVLVATGMAGERLASNPITLDGRQSLTARVFASPNPEFVGDMETDERIDHEVASRMDVRAAFFQPVARDGRPIGVLVVYWREAMTGVSERVRSLLELFATQVAGVVERTDLMSRLESLARTDSLTGLANRRALEETLVGELARADRSGQPLSVVMLDIDHFKAYNDRKGHQAGDGLLRELAAAWARELRTSDTLARFGGEEFLAVLPATDSAAASAVADRLRRAMPAAATISAGVATWETHETMVDLVARADAALYEAKRLGRDRIELANSSGVKAVSLRVEPPIAGRKTAKAEHSR